MKQARSGVIINVASVNAFRGQPEMLAYNASKAALVSLTKTLSVELGPHGVRAVCVCPGSVNTPIWDRGGWDDERDAMAQTIPLRRFADPAEIAAVVAFLASDDASFITGCAIVADGGLTARMF
jgi:NAD(P)-dependent dehydrogenase (short-subunit alcohol dehydrogenase family)